jgi:hypothetical protein
MAADHGTTVQDADADEAQRAAALAQWQAAQFAAAQAAAAAAAAASQQAAQQVKRSRRPRRSAGGRWLVFVLRPLVWAILLVIGFQGLTSIVTSYFGRSRASADQASQQPDGFPVPLAQAFALEFAQVYLNFTPAAAAHRAAALATFLPPGADPELGWDGVGTQSAQAIGVAGVTVSSSHSAVVTLLARVSGRLVELAVPVYAARGGMVVAGEPALLPGPAGVALPAQAAARSDPAAMAALEPRLTEFFQAFASGQARLRGFLAPGVRMSGLGGSVAFGGLSGVSVSATGGTTRQVTATVAWHVGRQPAGTLPSVAGVMAEIEMTYAVTVVRSGGTWYVQSVSAALAQPGSGP